METESGVEDAVAEVAEVRLFELLENKLDDETKDVKEEKEDVEEVAPLLVDEWKTEFPELPLLLDFPSLINILP